MAIDPPDPPADGPLLPRWDITVSAAFEDCNVVFLPWRTYRVSQRVYSEIQAQCATASVVPDTEP